MRWQNLHLPHLPEQPPPYFRMAKMSTPILLAPLSESYATRPLGLLRIPGHYSIRWWTTSRSHSTDQLVCRQRDTMKLLVGSQMPDIPELMKLSLPGVGDHYLQPIFITALDGI
ncbi:hypothetical protein TWF730_000050 [Orbilia blumenaviensis]|uniref:Uncharacterized protein n=1 Tax=Orbilia blumenaviensis TaxID=1796055 RepID=A0AAV9VKL8_9PEZI